MFHTYHTPLLFLVLFLGADGKHCLSRFHTCQPTLQEAAFGAEVQALLAAQLQPRAKALGLEDDLWRDGVVRPTAPMLRLCRYALEWPACVAKGRQL